jgi:sulfur carrier protein
MSDSGFSPPEVTRELQSQFPEPDIRVSVNGELRQLPDPCNLAMAIRALGMTGTPLAAAVNGSFVPRGLYTSHWLLNDDSIDLVRPVGGG